MTVSAAILGISTCMNACGAKNSLLSEESGQVTRRVAIWVMYGVGLIGFWIAMVVLWPFAVLGYYTEKYGW